MREGIQCSVFSPAELHQPQTKKSQPQPKKFKQSDLRGFLSKPSSVAERDEANEDEVKNSSFVINFFCKYLNSAH